MISDFNEVIITDINSLIDSIEDIERVFRHSKAYRVFLKYMKETLKMRKCDYFVSNEEYKTLDFVDSKIDLELHHQIRLYELALMAGQYLLDRIDVTKGEYFTIFDVVNELIVMHYEDYLPFVMMSTTIHQLYHNGLYTLKDNETVHKGRTKDFIEKYNDYITEDIINHYKEINVDITQYIKHKKEVESNVSSETT